MSNMPFRNTANTGDTPSGQDVATSVSQQFDLVVGFATVLHVAEDVSAIVAGNSDIADGSIVTDGILALTGKAVGTTDILVFGSEGDLLCELWVHVEADKTGAVTAHQTLQ